MVNDVVVDGHWATVTSRQDRDIRSGQLERCWLVLRIQSLGSKLSAGGVLYFVSAATRVRSPGYQLDLTQRPRDPWVLNDLNAGMVQLQSRTTLPSYLVAVKQLSWQWRDLVKQRKFNSWPHSKFPFPLVVIIMNGRWNCRFLKVHYWISTHLLHHCIPKQKCSCL